MTTQEVKRKLAAILSADVKGYSRLMGEDEVGTILTLNIYKEVMAGLIQHHRGRVVDAPGDNVLAEFGSVVDAVQCAVEIQKELKDRNKELPEDRRMEFRIGVNLGDVVEDGEQILGDGVNIAARLESLSEAGGICISGTAFDHVRNKLDLGYEYLGEQTVKNIALPVRVYKVLMEPRAAGKVIGEKKAKPRQWPRVAVGLVIVLIIIVAAVVVWKIYTPPTSKMEVASKEKMAFPLPDKPSIAVMPFVNMTGDPSQEFFCDGFSENLITDLSKLPQLFVIARESTFSYKGKAVKVNQVAEELGVQYVLEGSVQRAGGRVRVTAQLIDALKGHHLWADRYDREWKELFAIQDEITKQIISALQVKITWGEISSAFARGTENLEAYMKASEAIWYCSQGTIEAVNRARQLAQEAVALDPKYPTAYLALGLVHMLDAMLGLSKNRKESLESSNKMLQRAVKLDPSFTKARGVLAFNLVMLSRHDEAVAEGERCYQLEPNSAAGLYWYGMILISVGRVEEAASLLKEALRLNPIPPNVYLRSIAIALRELGRYEEAIAYLKRAVEREPNDFLAYYGLAATYSMAGRMEEARAAAKEVLRINPRITRHYTTFPIKDPVARERLAEALGKAGLPD
jgi:adenylate cyclase